MMRTKVLTLCVWFSVLALSAPALAGEKAPPIQGKAPPKAAPKKEAAAAAVAGPYDLSKLDPIDVATKKAIDALAERCRVSEFMREGPSPQEVAKCNAAVASVGAQGKRGASAILAVLNDSDYEMTRFGRGRLYEVLGKIEDEKVRGVLIDGLAKMASEKMKGHIGRAGAVDTALREMAGSGPEAAIPWDGKSTVRDEFADAAASSTAWRAFHKANEGKTRAQITQEVVTKARVDKKSDDPKKAYRAIVSLLQHSPKEALGAVKAYRKRSDLAAAVDDAFESLESSINWKLEVRASGKKG